MFFNISRYFSAITTRLTGINTEYEEDMLLFNSILEYRDLQIDTSNTYFSRLKNNSTDPDGAIRDAIQNKDVIAHVIDYFDTEIVPILNPHTGLDCCTDIINGLKEDDSINEHTFNSYIEMYNEDRIGEFLANTFMYALSKPNKYKNRASIKGPLLSQDGTLDKILQTVEDIHAVVSTPIHYTNSDLSLALSNEYDLTYSAPTSSKAFRILITVGINSIPTESKDFKSVLDYITFSGKSVSLQVCEVCVEDYTGRELKRITNSLFVGERITLPIIHSMHYSETDFSYCPSNLLISPTNNHKILELRNSNGDILLPSMTYRLEREKTKECINASFISEEHNYLNIRINFSVPNKEFSYSEINTSISITLKHNGDTLCNIQYYDLLMKLSNSDGLTFYQVENQTISEFINAQGFTPTHNGLAIDSEGLLGLFKELYFIEKHFNIKFDTSEFTQDNIYHAQILYRLLKEKKVITGSQSLSMEYDPEVIKTVNLENIDKEPLMVDCSFDNITVFDQNIVLPERYHMRWFSRDISLLPNNQAKINAYATVIYEYGSISENEIQRVGEIKPERHI